MARRGARALRSGEDGAPPTSASDAWRAAVAKADQDEAATWEPDEVWVLEPEEDPAAGAPGHRPATGSGRPLRRPQGPAGRADGQRRTGPRRDRTDEGGDGAPHAGEDTGPGGAGQAGGGGPRHTVPRPVVDELANAAGATRGSRLAGRLADASHAYDRERYQEARRMLRLLVEEVPDAVAVQELYGLTLYRMGQWAQAAKHLERYRELSGAYDQHPVLADCYRALRRYPAAAALWDELREASPSAELVAEGRIVAAGCRADQGDLQGAIAILERSARRVNHPADHHLRQWYALADLYERAGDLPRARELFGRIGAADPDAYDVRQRLRALR